jgi:hypothetical protein
MQHLSYLRTTKCHLRFAHIWPPNGQTAKNRAKPSPPSRSPLNLSPEKKSPWPNGFSRRTRLSHEILPIIWRWELLRCQVLVLLLLQTLHITYYIGTVTTCHTCRSTSHMKPRRLLVLLPYMCHLPHLLCPYMCANSPIRVAIASI